MVVNLGLREFLGLKKENDRKKVMEIAYGQASIRKKAGEGITEEERIELLRKASEGAGILIKSESQVPEIEERIKRGEIVLLNVAPMSRNTTKLKKIVSNLKGFVMKIDGDIARIDNDKILLTPAKVKIVKSKPKQS
jgi:SepF-like predicted cell division protein (DUF552 family)